MTGLARLGGFLVARSGSAGACLSCCIWRCWPGQQPAGADVVAGRCRAVHAWQPLSARKDSSALPRSPASGLLLLVGMIAYGPWLLLLWATFVTALVGGRVLFVDHRGTRLFYLLAFGYLLSGILLYLVPHVVPGPPAERALLEKVFVWAGPAALAAMMLLPVRDWVGGASRPVRSISSIACSSSCWWRCWCWAVWRSC